MLLNVFIRNFGIIDQMKMDFQSGFNVLTGETGTGKSIIIEALMVALGGRVSQEQIRSGAEKSVVQVTFDAGGLTFLTLLMEEHGIEAPEDDLLVLSREIVRSGKNICRINGQVVNLGLFRRIGASLADLHVQHEHNALLGQERHRQLLDRFGGPKLMSALKEVNLIFDRWRVARQKYEELIGDALERARRVDMLRYQVEDIRQAGLSPGEEEELAAEKMMLVNTEKISLLAEQAYSLLYEGSSVQAAAVDLLARATGSMGSLLALDPRPRSVLSLLENALNQVQEAARELSLYKERVEYSPQRLEAVEERLERVKRLKKKYGTTVPGVLEYLDQAQSELEALENVEEVLEATGRQVEEFEALYSRVALVLSVARREAAKSLEEAVARELLSLEMRQVEFRVAFTDLDGPSQGGAEKAEYLISPNPGEPLKPLAKIASGGELTRIMLALKVLLAGVDDIPVLVFDEADTGVGGRALQAVAEKMSQLGESRQVICVTHSAHIASHAVAHHRIVKEYDGDRTVTRIELLDPQGRLEELARMLGGRDITEITLRHAGQMLRRAGENQT